MPLSDMPLQELRKYKPPLYRQSDFADFWKRTKKESNEYPLNVDMHKVDYPLDKVDVYEIYYDGFKNGRVYGILIKPADCDNVPVLLNFHGYGGYSSPIFNLLPYVFTGYATFAIDVRGQLGKSIDGNVYKNGHNIGCMTMGIYSPEDYFYRAVYMDCARAVDVIVEMDSINSDRIGVIGGSQGGGLSLAVGGLDERVKCIVAGVPYLSNYPRAIEVASEGPYLELLRHIGANPLAYDDVIRTLSYFDVMNIAPDIKAPALISVGLQDTICPPSTIFSVYNHMKCEKEIKVYYAHGHSEPPLHQETMMQWFREKL